MTILGNSQIGFFNPDYTAYEQLLGLFIRTTPSMFVHRDVNKALMPPEEFEFQAAGRGVSSFLLSNPSNPTGQCIEGDDLKEYVRIARENEIAVIMDEFYSHYFYDGDGVAPQDGGVDDDTNWPKTVSSAAYIEDVNKDPIMIVNGLTKNWRCPGFRCCWVVGPAPIIDMLGSAGSYLDGGANAPIQQLALPLMELDFIRKDAWALQRFFKKKRDFLLSELDRLGISVAFKPIATFYIWGDLSKLPPPLNDCFCFLRECVKHQIVCVPGAFFDINPRGTRNIMKSSCISNMRFSYGPKMENLVVGMKKMEKLINEFKKKPMSVEEYILKTITEDDKEINKKA